MQQLREPIPDDQYVWAFGRAIEIEPVEEVAGKQHLWTLPDDVAARVALAEARSRAGEWTARVSQRKLSAAKQAWQKRWAGELFHAVAEIQREAEIEMEIEDLEFSTDKAERRFRTGLHDYLKKNGVVRADRQLFAKVEPHLQALFKGQDLVSVLELELALRQAVHYEIRADQAWERAQLMQKKILETMAAC